LKFFVLMNRSKHILFQLLKSDKFYMSQYCKEKRVSNKSLQTNLDFVNFKRILSSRLESENLDAYNLVENRSKKDHSVNFYLYIATSYLILI